jgi:transposase-like protein
MKVRCGLMTASQAAAELGVSRKTYYKWEQRGLAGLLDGVADQAPGRPENPDTTTEQNLKKQLAELKNENQLLEQKMALKDLAIELNLRSSKDRAKKK